MSRFMLLLFLLAMTSAVISTSVASTIYRWVDQDGNVVLSDRPPPPGVQGQQIEELAPISVIPAPEPEPDRSPEAASPETAVVGYDELAITSPGDDEAVRSNNGNVTVSVRADPALATGEGHTIRLMLDGREAALGTGTFPLTNLDRGSHSLQAQVIDRDGAVLISSPSIRFHVIRHFEQNEGPAPAPGSDPYKPQQSADPFKAPAP